jgi:hypothetical protein
MNFKDIKGLKYFLGYAMVTISAFAYSGISGYKWFGSTPTEEEKPSGTSRGGHYYRYYHK